MTWLLFLLSLLVPSAHAQPACQPQLQGTVACFPRAVNPQPTDLLSGMQTNGPTKPSQSVGFTLQQITNTIGGFYLPLTGGTVTGPTTFGSTLSTAGNTTLGSSSATTVNIGNNGSTTNILGQTVIGLATLPYPATPTVINPAFLSNLTLAGGPVASPSALNWFNINADTLNGANIRDIQLVHSFGGTGFAGTRTGMLIDLVQGAAIAHQATAQFITGIQSSLSFNYNQGGTDNYLHSEGEGSALNPYFLIGSGGTFLTGGSAMEANFAALAGSSYAEEIGLLVVHADAHAVSGSRTSTAFDVADQPTAAGHGWAQAAFQVGNRFGGVWPLQSGAAIIRAEVSTHYATMSDPSNAAFGDDYLLANFSTAAFRSLGFLVDGSGNVQMGNVFFTRSGGNLTINPMNSVEASATVATGGSGFIVGDMYATDPYGGVWTLTVNGSGVVTALTLYRAGTYAGTTPPANPVTLTPSRDDPATGLTANITWTTSGGSVSADGTTVSIGPTTATTINIGNSGSTMTLAGAIKAGASTGVTCSGTPTSSFASTNGIVTHC